MHCYSKVDIITRDSPPPFLTSFTKISCIPSGARANEGTSISFEVSRTKIVNMMDTFPAI